MDKVETAISILIYVIDTDVKSEENILATVDKLVDYFKAAIRITVRIFNVWYSSQRKQSEVVCSHAEPASVECCYSKPLFLHNHRNKHRMISLSIPPSFITKPNIPYYISTDYEAVTFTKSQVGAECAFVYSKKQRGVWQMISELLPFPEQITGNIFVTNGLSDKKSIYGFNKYINTAVTRSLLDISVDD